MILNQIPIVESLWHHITPISRSKRLFAPQTTVRGMFPASVRRRRQRRFGLRRTKEGGREGRSGDSGGESSAQKVNERAVQYKRLFFPLSFPRMQGVQALLTQIAVDQISPSELVIEPLTPFEILHNRLKSLQCNVACAMPPRLLIWLSAAAARATTTKTASPTSLVSAAEQSSLNGWMDHEEVACPPQEKKGNCPVDLLLNIPWGLSGP